MSLIKSTHLATSLDHTWSKPVAKCVLLIKDIIDTYVVVFDSNYIYCVFLIPELFGNYLDVENVCDRNIYYLFSPIRIIRAASLVDITLSF